MPQLLGNLKRKKPCHEAELKPSGDHVYTKSHDESHHHNVNPSDFEGTKGQRDYPRKTNMTSWKIHHEWRCISYWKWEFPNVMLVSRGVPVGRNLSK